MNSLRLTAEDLCRAIGQLPRNRAYHYVHSGTKTQLQIVDVVNPEGPISIRRYDPSKGGAPATAPDDTISPQMLWRVANAFAVGHPINLDRVLGASYNTRSALETLLAHTPQFYFCYPGRVEFIRSSSDVRRGHKHLLWLPDSPHELGVMARAETDVIISEIPSVDAVYDSLSVPASTGIDLPIEIQRRHAQIQIALIAIGRQLGFRTWVAQNDRGIVYGNTEIGKLEGVIATLRDEQLIAGFNAVKYALMVDCIWFKNHRLMPAVLEIEHTTGVTSGLTRMKTLQDALPPFPTRYVVVAADEDRSRVVREATKPQFSSLDAKFFPYSAVEELYSLCQRRRVRGVTEEFLDCFMEQVSP